MTQRQFFYANLLKKIGLSFKQKRLIEGAQELRLLKEAEEILGRSVWTKVKEIDLYRDSYLNINHLLKEKVVHQDKIREIKAELEEIKVAHDLQLKSQTNPEHHNKDEFDKQKIVLEKLKTEQAEISKSAASIKLRFDQSVSRLQTLMSQAVDINQDEVSAEKVNIERLKNEFESLKNKKTQVDQNLVKENAEFRRLSDILLGAKNSYQSMISTNYETLGKVNKALSTHFSQIGHIDSQIIQNYGQIGQGISNSWQTNPECKVIVKHKLVLCKIMIALRKSINLNQILADR